MLNLIDSFAFKFKKNDHENDVDKRNHDENFDCKRKILIEKFCNKYSEMIAF